MQDFNFLVIFNLYIVFFFFLATISIMKKNFKNM